MNPIREILFSSWWILRSCASSFWTNNGSNALETVYSLVPAGGSVFGGQLTELVNHRSQLGVVVFGYFECSACASGSISYCDAISQEPAQ